MGWYYSRDGKTKTGPVTSTELQALAKSGKLLPTDMVMKDGVAKWSPANKIKGLFNGAVPQPASSSEEAQAAPSALTTSPSAEPIWEKVAIIAASVVFCFPIGLILVWRHSTWSQVRKWKWTGATLGVFFCLALLGQLTSPPRTKDKSAPVVAQVTAQQPAAPQQESPDREVLAADFYPHKPGATFQTYQMGRFGNSGVEMDIKREYRHLDGGVIEQRTLQITVVRPVRKDMPGGPPIKLLRREKNGFLEIGKNEEVLKDMIFWNPLIKIGAVAGDEWQGGSIQFPNREDAGEPKAHFKLVGFAEEKIVPSLMPSGKVLCATIEETLSAGGITGVTEHVLGKGLGPVRTIGSEVKNGVRKETFRESIQPPKK